MALGSVGGREGRVYTSLGSSSWIAVNTKEPVLDFKTKPYVFAHIQENMYTSAFSIFAGGTSQDKSVNIRGAFLGLNLGTGRAELVHAAMEGIAMNLKLSLDELEKSC